MFGIFYEFIKFVVNNLSHKNEPTLPFNLHTINNGQISKRTAINGKFFVSEEKKFYI